MRVLRLWEVEVLVKVPMRRWAQIVLRSSAGRARRGLMVEGVAGVVVAMMVVVGPRCDAVLLGLSTVALSI